MGTLGRRWKLRSDIREKRAKKITAIWKGKSIREKNRIRKKKLPGLRKARRQQAKNGLAPETNSKIRKKISKSMKKLRKTKPPHNQGVVGYRNAGSWKKGHVPWIAGKRHTKKARKVMSDKSGTPEQKRRRVERHNESVDSLASKFRKKGLKVWTCFCNIPDILVWEGSRLIAYEVTNSQESAYRVTKKKRHRDGFFDEVRWVNLEGEKRT